jgi:hypothetical protein
MMRVGWNWGRYAFFFGWIDWVLWKNTKHEMKLTS